MKNLFHLMSKVINKKFPAFLLIFCFFPFAGIPQQKENPEKKETPSEDRKGFIEGSLGLCVPLGNFSSAIVNNEDAGLALSGFEIRAGGGYRLHKYFGLLAKFNSQAFLVNTGPVQEYLKSQNSSVNYSVTSNSGWSRANLLCGVFGYFPIDSKKKLIIEPRALIGFGMSTSPSMKITAYVVSGGVTQSVSSEQFSAPSSQMVFSYFLGASLQYNIDKKFFLTGNLDYIGSGSKYNYKNVIIEYSDGSKEITDFKMDIRSFNITAGFGLRFGS